MKQEVLIGQTDYTVLVKMRDDAGAPATGLAHTDIDIAYSRVETDNDVTTADVSPADLANLTATHSDWGWEEVSATDHPGLYRLDIADAVFASGAWSAVVTITGTGLDPADLEFVLIAFNPRDGVRLGLTSLPNAAADGAGGLPISDAGGLDLDTFLGRITGNVALASVVGALADAAVDGDPTTSDTLMQYIKQIVNTLVGTAGIPTFPSAAAPGNAVSLAEVLRQIYDSLAASPTVAQVADEVEQRILGPVLTRTTIASLSSQTSFTITAGSADDDAYNDCVIVVKDASTAVQRAVGVISDYTGSTKTVTLRADPGIFTMANGDTVVILASRSLKPTVPNRTLDVSAGGEAGLDWNNIGSPTTAQGLSGTTIGWNAAWDAEVESEVADALEATIADSIPSDGTRPSVKQALYMLTQFMTDRGVSGTTVTVKKVDGSTTLFTLTLNDGTTPTSITRS